MLATLNQLSQPGCRQPAYSILDQSCSFYSRNEVFVKTSPYDKDFQPSEHWSHPGNPVPAPSSPSRGCCCLSMPMETCPVPKGGSFLMSPAGRLQTWSGEEQRCLWGSVGSQGQHSSWAVWRRQPAPAHHHAHTNSTFPPLYHVLNFHALQTTSHRSCPFETHWVTVLKHFQTL